MTPRQVEVRAKHWLRGQGIDGQVQVEAERQGARMLLHIHHEDWGTTVAFTSVELGSPMAIDRGIQFALAGACRP